MKMLCISDNIDIAVGLKMTGIKYEIMNKNENLLEKISKISDKNEYGIVLISEELYNNSIEEIDKYKKKNNLPLIMKIPNKK